MKKKPGPASTHAARLRAKLRTAAVCAGILVVAVAIRRGAIQTLGNSIAANLALQLISALTVGSLLAIVSPRLILERVREANPAAIVHIATRGACAVAIVGVALIALLRLLPATAGPYRGALDAIAPSVVALVTAVVALYATILTFLTVARIRTTAPAGRSR